MAEEKHQEQHEENADMTSEDQHGNGRVEQEGVTSEQPEEQVGEQEVTEAEADQQEDYVEEKAEETIPLSEYEELKQGFDELNEKYLRLAAEFENFKKRTERDHSRRLQFANEEFIREILPIMDDLERAVQSSREDASFERLQEGLEIVYENFKEVLKQRGIEPIESVGEPFNPDYHDAMMTRESEEYESETVIDEFQRGYKMGDKVLRHAKVVVSK